jgi:hypothetical protein
MTKRLRVVGKLRVAFDAKENLRKYEPSNPGKLGIKGPRQATPNTRPAEETY